MAKDNPVKLEIPPRARFACIALPTNVSSELGDYHSCGEGVFALRRAPFEVDEFWSKSLGTIYDDRLSETNLLLFAFGEEAGSDDQALKRMVDILFYSLLIQGEGYSVDGLVLGGYTTPKGLHVSSVGDLDKFYSPRNVLRGGIESRVLNESMKIAAGLHTIFRALLSDPKSEQFLRLRKGFNIFLKGVRENQAHERLHQFVRAIEAVMRPAIGATRKQFTHRGQVFAGRSEENRRLLGELFDMRSAAEHLNPLKEVLINYSDHERENVIALRTYQAELLASDIYVRILTSSNLLTAFESDRTIAEFWMQTDDELMGAWGRPLDLDQKVAGRFYDYL